MRKSQLNFLIDSLAFAAFLSISTTGVLMKYLLPPGSGHFSTIWGLDRHQWGDIHFWISLSFFVILALHLFLHWRWIICMIRGKIAQESGKRFALGIFGVLGILAISLSPLFSPVEMSSKPFPGKFKNMRIHEDDYKTRESTEIETKSDINEVYTGNEKSAKATNKPATSKVQQENIDIRGYMTMKEIEEKCGIPYQRLLDKLNITEDVESDEQAGRLMRKYGYTMRDLRNVIDTFSD